MFAAALLNRLLPTASCLRVAAALLGLNFARAAGSSAYDVVVYGGTSAGVVAAIEAGRMGQKVALIEPSAHLGGMTSGGLGYTDIGDVRVVGGITREFYERIFRHYHRFVPGAPVGLQWQFEPHVAEDIFRQMLGSAGVDTLTSERLDRGSGVIRSGRRIRGIAMESGRKFRARVFIDATYEGDLMAAAGISYRIGRESVADYHESLNGVYPEHAQPIEIDPFVRRGDPKSGLLPGVESVAVGPPGSGDDRVQHYNLRICLTNDPVNRVPLTQPPGYNPLPYELLARYFAQHEDLTLADVVKLEGLPANKVDLNTHGFFSTDMPGPESTAWAEASYAERAKSYEHFLRYSQGLLWFLSTDPRVPPTVRQQAQLWGLPADEFNDNHHWPLQVYVREARRMRGAYTETQHDCENTVPVSDSVACGSYAMDSHTVTLYADARGVLHCEGFYYGPASAYPVSYRAIVPRAAQAENLLVPVCLSATHVAFDSIRIEPTFMMLGQAAGAAASLAARSGTSVQTIPYATLAARLETDGQIIRPPDAHRADHLVATADAAEASRHPAPGLH